LYRIQRHFKVSQSLEKDRSVYPFI